MAEKSTGFVLWTIYLVLCGFGYAGYVFYLAATGAYEIVELEKIEMTRQLDKVYRLDHAVTKTQKVILSAFDMDWNYVKYRAENISRILKVGEIDEADMNQMNVMKAIAGGEQ